MNRPLRFPTRHTLAAILLGLWSVACLMPAAIGAVPSPRDVDDAAVSAFDAASLPYSKPSDSENLYRLCQTNWGAEYPSAGLLSLEISRRSTLAIIRSVELSQRFPLATPLTLGVALRL